MHARIIKHIRTFVRNFTALLDERHHAISLSPWEAAFHLALAAIHAPSTVVTHVVFALQMLPPTFLQHAAALPPYPPTPPFRLVPLRLLAISSPSRPPCGRIPSMSASRSQAYVSCHTPRPRMPPYPNPPVCSSWSVFFPPRHALNSCCRTTVDPRFCRLGGCM